MTDTRILLHFAHAAEQGQIALVKTIGRDWPSWQYAADLRHIRLSAEQYILQVSADERPPSQVLLHKLGSQEVEEYTFLVDTLKEPCISILLWDEGDTISCPCTGSEEA